MRNRVRWSVLFLLTGATSLTGCGGVEEAEEASPSPKAPEMVRGGGVAMGPIGGVLNVFVVDERSGQPVSGAAVRVDNGVAATPCAATSDSSGLAVFAEQSCPGLRGPQTVTASAATFAPSTWIGVNGASLTISLQPVTSAAVETATVEGTIDLWKDLPSPANNHTTLAVVGYTQTGDLDDPVNHIAQGKRSVSVAILGSIEIGANICVRNVLIDDCRWRLTTRTGRQALYAMILDQDTKGTPNDDSDDTFTVTHWAVKTGVTLQAGQVASGEALTLVADSDMTTMTVAFSSGPPGLDDVAAVPLIDLGGEGRMVVVSSRLAPGAPSTRVPKTVGPLAAGRYDVLGVAQDAQDKQQPSSLSWQRGVDIGAPVMVNRWLSPPAELAVSAGTYSFAPVAGATIHRVALETTSGSPLWSITVFDRSTTFTLPGLSPDPLPPGMVRLHVSAIELPGVDPSKVSFADLRDTMTRLSSNELNFVR